ncbi:MAG: extracellular solute-binding protein [Dehalococcoidia bacterium]|nr:extracellular solute-binding protein [Dehalococcoidia bacterium]
MTNNQEPNRRAFLRIGGLSIAAGAVLACAPAAAPAAPAPTIGGAPKADWERQWDDVLAGAKKEGKLVLITSSGAEYRKVADAFTAKFPEITVEQVGLVASQFVPRVLQERKAGAYNFDVLMSSTTTPLINLRPEGAIDPVRPIIFRADVLDDKAWAGGFDAGFLDNDKKWCYACCTSRNRVVWINTDQVQAAEVTKVEDLLNPKWKGRILSGDVRSYGGGAWPATVTRLGLGDDIMKRLWKDQEAVLGRDPRQMTEQMVRAQYAIGYGALSDAVSPEFEKQGLMKSLRYVPMENVDYLSSSQNNAFLVNRAPNPNAARLFINWILTKEGQTLWAPAAAGNSRRTDVPPSTPDTMPTPGRKYITIDTEAMLPEVEKTYALAKQLLA